MIKMVQESGIGSIQTMLKLKLGMDWGEDKFDNIIVSNISQSTATHKAINNSRFIDISTRAGKYWAMALSHNINDVENPVKCFTVF